MNWEMLKLDQGLGGCTTLVKGLLVRSRLVTSLAVSRLVKGGRAHVCVIKYLR